MVGEPFICESFVRIIVVESMNGTVVEACKIATPKHLLLALPFIVDSESHLRKSVTRIERLLHGKIGHLAFIVLSEERLGMKH